MKKQTNEELSYIKDFLKNSFGWMQIAFHFGIDLKIRMNSSNNTLEEEGEGDIGASVVSESSLPPPLCASFIEIFLTQEGLWSPLARTSSDLLFVASMPAVVVVAGISF